MEEPPRDLARQAARQGGQRAADFAAAADFATEFVGYAKTDVLTQLGALEELGDGTFLAKLRESPFYPAGGGQVTDHGWIELDGDAGTRAELVDAYRFDDDQALLFRGDGLRAGRPRARRSSRGACGSRRWRTTPPRISCTQALREVLGEHVKQAGSAVRPDKLRFDFTHAQALTADERERGRARSSTSGSSRTSR